MAAVTPPAPLPAVGFLGTGIMGASMAGHLLAAGHQLHVSNRTRAKAEPLLARGGVWHDSPAAVAAAADVVITMLGLPADVEEVYLGGSDRVPAGQGLVAAARPGSLLVDMTTSSPALAARIAAAAAARGIAAVDAPVSGGDLGARNATLVIMAGGEAAAFERARPLFDRLGRSATLLGPAGSGQRCKLANQVAVAESGLDFPGLAVAERLYQRLADAGRGDEGTQALYDLSGPLPE
jgi:3-hydroxyisobutyrate dehydrogenase